ncbi:HTH-type transcriptional regulator CymR [bioreactor metagenome]|uniref:HTH-type transcriptional regulator CymR n=1 Tax=bioreactor metagenome TaxID=1076179 RepID=A0A644YR48_9ZZZZ
MRISTKGRYALRFLLDVAVSGNGSPVSLRDAALRQEISEKYLEQIVTQLARAGLVRSIRGAGGGYLLTRSPKDYTMGDILRPMEGDLVPVECVAGGGCCKRIDQCVTVEVWQRISEAVSQVVDSITLEDLIGRYYQKQEAR